MDNSFIDNLGRLVLNYPTWTHIIIALGIMLQGELTVLLSMYLIADGDLTWSSFFLTVFGAFFVAETFIYFLGKNLRGTIAGQRFRQKIPYGDKIENYLKGSVFKVIIIAKFIIGSTIIVMFMTGWSGVKFKKFIQAQILSVLIWLPVISGLAYSFAYGLWYLKSIKVFQSIEIGLGIIAIIIIGSEYILKKLFKTGIVLETKAEKIGKAVEKNLPE